MEKEEKYRGIEELLPRFCEGMTTLEESHLVEEWIAEDEEHLRLVNQIHALHLAMDTLEVVKHTDIDKALSKVKRRMHEKNVSWWKWAQRIAALLSIPLLLGSLWLYFNKKENHPIVQMVEVRTNPGMTTKVILPDSTLVYLNSESLLRYPSTFTTIRNVELVGEAFFNVVADKEKRFVVNTRNQSQIEVYGTSFNVEAYAADNKISTTLIEGTIGFLYQDANHQTKKVDLKPNQKLVYEPEMNKVRLYATSGESETAWKDGKIILKNTPMKEVLQILEKQFNVEFKVRNRNLDTYSFTGTFTNQRLEKIMEYFKLSSQIKWRYIENPMIEDKKQVIEIY